VRDQEKKDMTNKYRSEFAALEAIDNKLGQLLTLHLAIATAQNVPIPAGVASPPASAPAAKQTRVVKNQRAALAAKAAAAGPGPAPIAVPVAPAKAPVSAPVAVVQSAQQPAPPAVAAPAPAAAGATAGASSSSAPPNASAAPNASTTAPTK
jgi:hypothetical protein